MNRQLSEIRHRRSELLARIAEQRMQLRKTSLRWETPLAIADRGLAVASFFRSHPVLLAGSAALLVVRRHGLAGLVRVVWQVWQGYRYFSALSGKLSQRD